jgi:hypothetical protein
MTVTTNPLFSELEDQALIARAADEGFRLVQSETMTGALVWEWRRGSEPRPQFSSRRVAVHWMLEFLSRHGGGPAVVPDSGPACSSGGGCP